MSSDSGGIELLTRGNARFLWGRRSPRAGGRGRGGVREKGVHDGESVGRRCGAMCRPCCGCLFSYHPFVLFLLIWFPSRVCLACELPWLWVALIFSPMTHRRRLAARWYFLLLFLGRFGALLVASNILLETTHQSLGFSCWAVLAAARRFIRFTTYLATRPGQFHPGSPRRT